MPRDYGGPGAFKEALTDIKITVLREIYSQDMTAEEHQNYILEELAKVFDRTPLGELTRQKS